MMNTQTQQLFEAPLTHEVAHYANPSIQQEYYSHPELETEFEWELQEGTHYSPALGEEEWEGAQTTSFVPIAVERPGGERIQNKRDPNPADIVIVRGVGGKRVPLHRLAAAAWRALVAKARADGISAPLLLINSGYRSSKRQKELWQAAKRKYGSARVAQHWVARPGGSAHQSGRAIDFYLGGKNSSENVAYLRTLPVYRWLVANAERFGFYPYDEPWHWEYNPPASGETAQEINPYASQEYSYPELGAEFEKKGIQFFKDSPLLKGMRLTPATPIGANRTWSPLRRRLAETYNRLGGLMQALARMVGIDVASVLAVWYVESGGRRHTPSQAIIRFENHLFYRNWGKSNESLYNRHFRHGGHAGQAGRAWQNHQFRKSASEPFQDFHGNQAREYEVLHFARQLGGHDPALLSISIGGPQILITHYSRIGYASPRQMFDAFQASERFHVLGFFDFCQRGGLLRFLRTRQWAGFARRYNGSGQVERYAVHLVRAYQEALQLPVPKS
jgi:LAS superfamily LD-carboxypeptidase LdcB